MNLHLPELDIRKLPDTPALLLYMPQFRANLVKMRDMAQAAGKKLRPHAKTHKCSKIALEQLKTGNCAGVCAAKLREAAALIQGGVKEILLTSPVVTEKKMLSLMELLPEAPELMVTFDTFSNAKDLSDLAKAKGLTLKVLLDIDPGMGRTGCAIANAPALVDAILPLPNLTFMGIQRYAGNCQHIEDFAERKSSTLQIMQEGGELVRLLRGKGIDCPIYTGTGTGTASMDKEVPELTDMQVGSYCMMDSEYLSIGSKENPAENEEFPPALYLLSSVISACHDGFVTLDAGLKSLYFTPATPPAIQKEGCRYDWHGDEHGMLFYPAGTPRPKNGDLYLMTTPHCDPTIALHERFHLWEEDGSISGSWEIDLRGCLQ